MIRRHTSAITTLADGSATVYLGKGITGRILWIKYTFGTLAATLDLAVTGETTAVPILAYTDVPAADAWFHPRVLPVLNTDGGTPLVDVVEQVWVFGERIKVVVAQGGASKAGSIEVYVDEEV